MINANNYIYSQAALARILEINPKLIVRFEVWDKVIFCIIKGKRPTFISKNLFKKEFIDFRKRNSELVSIVPHSVDQMLFLAKSKDSKISHQLEIVEGMTRSIRVRCDCEDYQNQRKFCVTLTEEKIFTNYNRKCKHILALESFLGGSLESYINELKALEEEYKYYQAKADLFGDYPAYA